MKVAGSIPATGPLQGDKLEEPPPPLVRLVKLGSASLDSQFLLIFLGKN